MLTLENKTKIENVKKNGPIKGKQKMRNRKSKENRN